MADAVQGQGVTRCVRARRRHTQVKIGLRDDATVRVVDQRRGRIQNAIAERAIAEHLAEIAQPDLQRVVCLRRGVGPDGRVPAAPRESTAASTGCDTRAITRNAETTCFASIADAQCIHTSLKTAVMPVTLTIKQVPERLADSLRRRAAANRRSQQQELLLLLERVADDAPPAGVAEPTCAVYRTAPARPGKTRRKAGAGNSGVPQRSAGRLSLDVLWQRARTLGAGMASEASSIVRADRDAGHR